MFHQVRFDNNLDYTLAKSSHHCLREPDYCYVKLEERFHEYASMVLPGSVKIDLVVGGESV